MNEKRVKQLIEKIELMRDEIEEAGIKWIEEEAHASCVKALSIATDGLGEARQALKSMVS